MATKEAEAPAGTDVEVVVSGKVAGGAPDPDAQDIVFKENRDAGPGGVTDTVPDPVDETAKTANADTAKAVGVSPAGLQEVATAAFLHQGWVPESEAVDPYATPVGRPVDLSRSDLPGAVLEAEQAKQNKKDSK